LVTLSSIDLRIADQLKDREFRRQWFRAMLETNVPERFRDLREARDLTQSELADAADMKQSAVSRFESQRVANWKLETLLKLADALDAQLEIALIPAEHVIASHEREESGAGSPPQSVIDASAEQRPGFNDGGSGALFRLKMIGLSSPSLDHLSSLSMGHLVLIDPDTHSLVADAPIQKGTPVSAAIASETLRRDAPSRRRIR
jgi:transcriptional regulator with XRE-family HTH domain